MKIKPASNDKDDHGADVDAVQTAIGNLGRWQIIVCLAISLVKFPVAWHQLAIVFMAPHQDYNCTEPAAVANSEDQCAIDVNGTLVECTGWDYDRRIFPETIISQVSGLTGRRSILGVLSTNYVRITANVIYRRYYAPFFSTIFIRVSRTKAIAHCAPLSFQWNLVCDRTHYANIQQSILMFGVLIGNIFFGSLSDRQVVKRQLNALLSTVKEWIQKNE